MSEVAEPTAAPAPPAPTVVQILAAVVVLGGCIFLASIVLVAYLWDGNPFNLIAIPIVGPLCYFLGTRQFRGTFQGDARSARQAMVTCYGIAAFFLFGYAANVSEYFQQGGRRLDVFVDCLFILVPTFAGLVLGRINQKRERTLRAWFEEFPEAQPLPSVTRREKLVGLGLVAVALAASVYLVATAPAEEAEHVTREASQLKNLPENATDVSYRRGVRIPVLYEFTTDEASFRRWVAEHVVTNDDRGTEKPLQEIVGKFRIPRYKRGDDREAVITDGVFYEWSYTDQGKHAAFDRTTKRAYFYGHSH